MWRLAVALVLVAAGARAQQPVWTVPQPATTTGGNASGTVTGNSSFKKVFSSTSPAPANVPSGGSPRHGCTLINQGSHNMYVTEGLGVAASTTSNSVILVPNQPYYCNWNGTVLTGEIDIAGTDGEAFYAAQY